VLSCVFVGLGGASPSVADLDGDGKMEVVVGTSVGFLYALNGHDGSNREGFPLQMGELQAQVHLPNPKTLTLMLTCPAPHSLSPPQFRTPLGGTRRAKKSQEEPRRVQEEPCGGQTCLYTGPEHASRGSDITLNPNPNPDPLGRAHRVRESPQLVVSESRPAVLCEETAAAWQLCSLTSCVLAFGFPTQVVIADVNDDGFPELVACDTRGNVGVFNWRGKEVWERHLRSLIAQGATVGDVNGDGRTEVVIGTSAGYIHPPLLGPLFF